MENNGKLLPKFEIEKMQGKDGTFNENTENEDTYYIGCTF